ncbi:MAG TPA: DUF4157 domain-containing protein [Longimicrobiaceae bacterium]|nr:DUF4157 domain-containing protein [Longimicrobiaceae bacterium]
MPAARERTTAKTAPEAAARRTPREAAAPRPGPAALLQRQLGNRAFRLASRGTRPMLQRCACGGTCAHCRGDREPTVPVQTKVEVGAPGDVYEQEADRVAERVMRMPEPRAAAPAPPGIRRLPAGAPAAGRADVSLPAGEGRPLASSTRAFMEPRIGADFSGVRVHSGPRSEAAADRLQARAFTYGSDVWLGRGAAEGDRRLMAHELTHVVQQGSAGPRVQRDPPPPPPQPQQPPPQECPGGVKTVTVDTVSLHGSSGDPLGDLAFANTVFAPCCVRFDLVSGGTVDTATTDSWIGADHVMSWDTSGAAVNAEESATYDGATSYFGLTSRLRVFYVDDITPGARALSRPAVFATGLAAPYRGMITVTNGAGRRTLAHEFGHVLLNASGAVHTTHPGGTDNLMEPTNTATGSRLEPSQCATVFANA